MTGRASFVVAILGIFSLGGCGDSFGRDQVTVTVRSTVNVRDAATTEGSKVIAKLEAGTELTGEWVDTGSGPRDKWLEFDFNGRKAFVWAGNLQGASTYTAKQNSSAAQSQQPNLSKYTDDPNFKIAEAAVRCVYYFQTLKIASAYSYSHHDYLAPYMITPEYLRLMQTTYEEEYVKQRESHRKDMNEDKYVNLYSNISIFYFKRAGLSSEEIKYLRDKIGVHQNKDIIQVTTLFTGGDLDFDEYSEAYKKFNSIGLESINCAATKNGSYVDFFKQYQ